MFDLIIRNALVIDGSGDKTRFTDIAIKDGIFVHVGKIDENEQAEQVLNVQGLHAIPGFVDIHRHGDLLPFSWQNADEELLQGITSFVNGNCGFSAIPSSAEHFEELRQYVNPIIGHIPTELKCASGRQLYQRISEKALSANLGYMVGAGALRICENGFEAGQLSEIKLERICKQLDELLDAGALGLSMGLMYVPENFTPFDQLAEMCKVPARRGKLTCVHMRGEGGSLLESVEEVINLAKEIGGKFHISHLKAAGKHNWNTLLPRALEKIQNAKDKGVNISYDVYPYCAGSTALYTLFPPCEQEAGISSLLKKLETSEFRTRMQKELSEEHASWDNIVASIGWNNVTIVGGADQGNVGKSVEMIAEERSISPIDCAMDLMLEGNGEVPIVIHSMCQTDMELALSMPDAIIISDALYSEKGMPHPRRYGAAARAICRYGERFGVEKMVRACTALPAERMGLSHRGRIAEGYCADMILLDMNQFQDRATYSNPTCLPEGIHAILLNGKIAVKSGIVLGRYGDILK